MSKSLSAVARTEFDEEVKHSYQGVGKLKGTVTLRTGVVGDTYKFRSMGKGLATDRGAPSSDIVPMNISHALQTATLSNEVAAEYTDIWDNAEVNFSEVSELASVIAGALGRKEDQKIIDGIYGASTSLTVGTDIGGVGTGMNLSKIRLASKLLNDNDVPMDERYFVTTSEGLYGMLGDTTITSADYNSVKSLVNGEIDTFMGFKFIMLGTRDEGGLTDNGTGSTAISIAYHKSAFGFAEGLEMKTSVDWVPTKDSWLSQGIMKSGGVFRDALGIVEITHTNV